MSQKNNRGFTLAELLIVVAIIAVLVAIAIPIFTSQLEKARESTDAANARSAYAEIMSAAILGEPITTEIDRGAYKIAVTSGSEGSYVYTATIPCKQMQADWQNDSIKDIAGQTPPTSVGSGKTITVKYTQGDDAAEVTAN